MFSDHGEKEGFTRGARSVERWLMRVHCMMTATTASRGRAAVGKSFRLPLNGIWACSIAKSAQTGFYVTRSSAFLMVPTMLFGMARAID